VERIERDGKFLRFDMTEEEYRELTGDYLGLCVACGEVRDSCEPDARRYKCEACEKHAVYNAEQLVMMGRIRFVGAEGEGGEP
jgi:hypothetical protein